MRKRILDPTTRDHSADEPRWLDVEREAEVELTSEDPSHPVESALRLGGGAAWRAAEAGVQTIRLRFAEPQRVERIRLVFEEREAERTQEFLLRWSDDGGRSYREIVRQQYSFSPSGAVREVEDYAVELEGATAIELRIVPDVSGGGARASLSEWRLG
jgi:hypothetical protein